MKDDFPRDIAGDASRRLKFQHRRLLSLALATGLGSLTLATVPCEAAAQTLRVLVFGDSGTGRPEQARGAAAMTSLCRSRGCDLALLLGDAVYGSPSDVAEDGYGSAEPWRAHLESRLFSPYASLASDLPRGIWLALGNHDAIFGIDRLKRAVDERAGWHLPALDYAIPGLPPWVEISAVFTPGLMRDDDTRAAVRSGSVDASALDRDAQLTRLRGCRGGNSEFDGWRLAFGHHPIVATTHPRNAALTAQLVPVLRACRVDAYLAGHAHRSEHLREAWGEQIVQGAAGEPRHKSGWQRWRRLFLDVAHSSEGAGFGLLTLTPEQLEIEFFDAEGTTRYRWAEQRAR